jgi:transcriptional regulator with XRE-family HTH domain
MSQLSDNLTARREELGLKVPDVHAELARRGVEVGESTVYGWFNGSRGVSVENLKLLADILQSSMDALAGAEEYTSEPVEVLTLREIRKLPAEKQELALAMIRSMQ